MVIATEASEEAQLAAIPAPVVRLRDHPQRSGEDDPTVYRYDRDELIFALRMGLRK